jgi:serine/threonine-protein kinase
MGTPKYMAPEQAAGHSKGVTTAADVYSVGAILYELLTGQPPFDGRSKAHTYELILNSEPKPPRKIKPAVPVDLEVVCLKCLRKRPADRYESARALADDLRAFLDGRSIRARPLGRAARSWRWCRRNPQVAGLLALVVVLACVLAIVRLPKAAQEFTRFLADQLDQRNQELKRNELLQQQLVLRLRAHENGWSGRAWSLAERAANLRHDDVDIVEMRDSAAAALVGLDANSKLKDIAATAVLWSAEGSKLLFGGTTDADGNPREHVKI